LTAAFAWEVTKPKRNRIIIKTKGEVRRGWYWRSLEYKGIAVKLFLLEQLWQLLFIEKMRVWPFFLPFDALLKSPDTLHQIKCQIIFLYKERISWKKMSYILAKLLLRPTIFYYTVNYAAFLISFYCLLQCEAYSGFAFECIH